MTDLVLSASKLCKSYDQGKIKVDVLKSVEFAAERGTSHAIIGASGAGKSTLMHLLGGLDLPTSGEISLNNQNIVGLSAAQLGHLRNRHLGFIYQFHHLLPEFNAAENIAMPLIIRGISANEANSRAMDWLNKVDLADRYDHKPGELSGGERQRVALARALVTEPDCLLADEPTGNLDLQTAGKMLDLMMMLNESIATTLIIVTHDPDIAARMQNCWRMQDGDLLRQ